MDCWLQEDTVGTLNFSSLMRLPCSSSDFLHTQVESVVLLPVHKINLVLFEDSPLSTVYTPMVTKQNKDCKELFPCGLLDVVKSFKFLPKV